MNKVLQILGQLPDLSALLMKTSDTWIISQTKINK